MFLLFYTTAVKNLETFGDAQVVIGDHVFNINLNFPNFFMKLPKPSEADETAFNSLPNILKESESQFYQPNSTDLSYVDEVKIIPDPPSLVKIIISGPAGVGKTQLLKRFVDDSFTEDYISTIGIDFSTKILNNDVKAQIWDTAGQERFRSITSAYYRGAAGYLLVYDISSYESFQQATNEFYNSIVQLGTSNPRGVLVGNKSDKYYERQVSRDVAENWALDHGFKFFEVSSKTSDNVNEAFTALILSV